MDPDADPGGPKSYGSYGSGSAALLQTVKKNGSDGGGGRWIFLPMLAGKGMGVECLIIVEGSCYSRLLSQGCRVEEYSCCSKLHNTVHRRGLRTLVDKWRGKDSDLAVSTSVARSAQNLMEVIICTFKLIRRNTVKLGTHKFFFFLSSKKGLSIKYNFGT
jgi:hypothetical protein